MMRPVLPLLLLLIASTSVSASTAGAGKRTLVARPSGWAAVVSGVAVGSRLFAVTRAGDLWAWTLPGGTPTRLARARFVAPRRILHYAGALLVFDGNGDLYRVDPKTLRQQRLGKVGAWKALISAVVLGDAIFSVERDGKMYRTDLRSLSWRIVGNPGWAKTKWMFSAQGKIYTIERVGALYAVDPATGSWQRTGRFGAWAATTALTTLAGKLYTTERDGKFYRTDPPTGRYLRFGKADFGETRLLFAVASRLYALDRDGALYHVALP